MSRISRAEQDKDRLTVSGQEHICITYNYAQDAYKYASCEFGKHPLIILHDENCTDCKPHAIVNGHDVIIFYPFTSEIREPYVVRGRIVHAIDIKVIGKPENNVIAQLCAIILYGFHATSAINKIYAHSVLNTSIDCPAKWARSLVGIGALSRVFLNQMLEGVYIMQKSPTKASKASEKVESKVVKEKAKIEIRPSVAPATKRYIVSCEFGKLDNANLLAWKLKTMGYQPSVTEG